jgi:NitT/TauT family transport system ATP-binding protein
MVTMPLAVTYPRPMQAPSAEDGPIIGVRDISHSFAGGLAVLSHVDLNVARGEFVAIVGPSGCGKTTLLNLMAGLLPVQSGALTVNGRTPVAGNREVAYMLARDALLPWLTARQNAEFGAMIAGQTAEERRERASSLLAKVGLASFEDAYPKALSHGMRQRAALARTFCLQSPILLMDEPFGALDAQTKLQLEETLLGLWQSERRTVVFITHDLSEAIALADRVVVMSGRPGRIVAIIDIPLARPRSIRLLQRDPQFHAIYSNVWETLEQGLSG